jgi:CRP/FNR family transcriptional regulator, cyclic AMP receptor protein
VVLVHLKQKERVDLLANVWLFEYCTGGELDGLQRAATEINVPAGRILARQGEIGREFVVIVEGKADVTRGGTRIAVLGAGSFFGEMSLLDHLPRTASVTTTEPTRLLVLHAAAFNSVVATMPSVDRKMLLIMSQRLRDVEAKYVPA